MLEKEGRGLVLTLVIALLAGQATASMFVLDTSTAQQFRQQNAPDATRNQLYLVIDTPGTLGSTIDWQYAPTWKKYGPSMALEVGFLGQLADTDMMQIGTTGPLPGGSHDSFGISVANDDDDYWSVRPYLTGATYTVPAYTSLDPGESAFITLTGISGTVTGFGFEVQYEGERGSDNFHLSTTNYTPVPGVLALTMLGMMSTLGLRRRRFV